MNNKIFIGTIIELCFFLLFQSLITRSLLFFIFINFIVIGLSGSNEIDYVIGYANASAIMYAWILNALAVVIRKETAYNTQKLFGAVIIALVFRQILFTVFEVGIREFDLVYQIASLSSFIAASQILIWTLNLRKLHDFFPTLMLALIIAEAASTIIFFTITGTEDLHHTFAKISVSFVVKVLINFLFVLGWAFWDSKKHHLDYLHRLGSKFVTKKGEKLND